MEYFSGGISLRSIFSTYWDSYTQWYKGSIRESVIENVHKLLVCCTPQRGFHALKCPNCKDSSEYRVIPHSCKSRFCPSCGKVATDNWINEKLSDILPVGYHHLVFTLPWQLRALCLVNRRVMFQLLFLSVRSSILDWCREYGGYIPGFYVVLHTFGSDLKFNPHFHVLITAGGLSLDHRKWIDAPENYLMPEKGLKKRWRFNVVAGLIKANEKEELEMPYLPKKHEYLNLRGVVSVISKLFWYVFMGTRLKDAEISVKYIGRYTKKPVIAEGRIVHCDDKWVIFRFKDYAEGGVASIKKMRLFTFITYLTQHIPDKFFRVVRGYGLFANRVKSELLEKAISLLPKSYKHNPAKPASWRERVMRETGKDPFLCQKCGTEMVLAFACYKYYETMSQKLGLPKWDRISTKQISIPNNTS